MFLIAIKAKQHVLIMGETTETEKRECLQTSFSCFLTLKNNHVCVNNPHQVHHRGFCL